jgi:hypothetical protein
MTRPGTGLDQRVSRGEVLPPEGDDATHFSRFDHLHPDHAAIELLGNRSPDTRHLHDLYHHLMAGVRVALKGGAKMDLKSVVGQLDGIDAKLGKLADRLDAIEADNNMQSRGLAARVAALEGDGTKTTRR